MAHPKVAEAAVVSKPHDIKGESVFAYVVLNRARPEGAAAAPLIEELRKEAWLVITGGPAVERRGVARDVELERPRLLHEAAVPAVELAAAKERAAKWKSGNSVPNTTL